MNKFVAIGAAVTFMLPIACVVGLKMNNQDLDSLFSGSENPTNRRSGKLIYFYAPS